MISVIRLTDSYKMHMSQSVPDPFSTTTIYRKSSDGFLECSIQYLHFIPSFELENAITVTLLSQPVGITLPGLIAKLNVLQHCISGGKQLPQRQVDKLDVD